MQWGCATKPSDASDLKAIWLGMGGIRLDGRRQMAAALPALALASLGESVTEATAERRDYLPRGPARRPAHAEGLGPAKDSSTAAHNA